MLLALALSSGEARSQSTLTAAQTQADFDVLRKSLEEAHGGLYRFAGKAETDRRFDAFRARLDRDMSQRDFISFIAEVVADARDGHARLEYDGATNAALAAAALFPLRVSLEGDRLIVLSNSTSADSVIRPGMELVRINGYSARDIIANILPKISGDGFIETGKRARLASRFAEYYWLFADSSSTYALVARDASGKQVTVTLSGVLSSERERNSNPVNARIQHSLAELRGEDANISLTYTLDSAIARLRIRSFGGARFTSELDSVFGIVRERGTKAMILDLRGNGGGVDEYGAFLVSRFVTRPFRYFDRIHLTSISPSFATWKPDTFVQMRDGTTSDPSGGYLVKPSLHSGVGEQKPAERPFTGELFVLADGRTFSTSADVTATLHNMKRATFVGEETGGGYEGNTSGLNALIVLPNSHLQLKIMMYEYFNAVKPPMRGRGTIPDHPVALRVEDMLSGIDTQMERAEALARSQVR